MANLLLNNAHRKAVLFEHFYIIFTSIMRAMLIAKLTIQNTKHFFGVLPYLLPVVTKATKGGKLKQLVQNCVSKYPCKRTTIFHGELIMPAPKITC